MASLISDSEKGNLVNIFQDIFDTFKREIVVYKEPVKIIQQINLENIFGYGPASNQTNYEFTPVFKKISAVVRYSKNHQFSDVEDGSILFPSWRPKYKGRERRSGLYKRRQDRKKL